MSEITENVKKLASSFNRPGKKTQTDLSTYLFDKLQPQAKALEEAVLGALMIDKNAVAETIDILKPEMFYVPANAEIFQGIMDLYVASKPIDILTVTEQLRKNGKLEIVGGPFYISQLTNRVGSSANIEHHARIVQEKFILRELISTSTVIMKDAYEDTTDVFQLLDDTEQRLLEISDKNLRRGTEKVNDLVRKAVEQIETISEKSADGELTGIPSGFGALDRITAGWQKSDLVIIAARPGVGKTSFVLSMARNAAVQFKKPVAMFSLEMSSVQLVTRLISAETELSNEKLKRGDLKPHEWTQLNTKVTQLGESALFIDDTPAINIYELRAKCRRLKQQHDIQMIIIDYLQLMSGAVPGKGGGSNREQEISNISRNLKTIAKELQVPVIALSQLNRSVETRGGDKRPMLSDLRESGAIEQDADMVIFLYRPDYYQMDKDKDGNPIVPGVTEVIISKHRNGATGTVQLQFIHKFAKFIDYEFATQFDANIENNFSPLSEVTMQSKMNEPNESGFESDGPTPTEDSPF